MDNVGPEVSYSITGEGTTDDAAVLTFSFNIAGAYSLKELRRQLPDTVTLENSKLGIGFKMRGVRPDMSRLELGKIFQALLDANGLIGKHHA